MNERIVTLILKPVVSINKDIDEVITRAAQLKINSPELERDIEEALDEFDYCACTGESLSALFQTRVSKLQDKNG